MFKFSHLLLSVLFLTVLMIAPTAHAQNPDVGTVTQLQAEATLIRQGRTLPLQQGSAIQKNDEITSSDDARVEITFSDGTTLTMGENSRLVIDEFLFEPDNSLGTIILNVLEGPFRFITGSIGKMTDKRAEVRTTSATIGIRGTDFWGGPSRGKFGVLLFDGVIVVSNASGARIVDQPGAGVDTTGANVELGEAVIWGQSRVDDAVATITFR